ncbi:MAG: helix-turn-helix domain-containing protein [Ferruginibacter sp.]
MQSQRILQVENITSKSLFEELGAIISKTLLSISENKQPETELITRQQVADIFGISLPTVHSWVNTGILTAYKIGNKTRFNKSEVLQACRPIKEKI